MDKRWRSGLFFVFTLISVPQVRAQSGSQTAPQSGTQEIPEAKAALSDMAWLQLVDAGKYAESWKIASPKFQAAVTQDKWQSAMQSVRAPLGKLIKRTLASAKFTKTLPGVPDGEYVVSLFETSFENKQSAQETVVSKREPDGSWRLAGYYIK